MSYVQDITVRGTTYQFLTSTVAKNRGYKIDDVYESLDYMARQYRKTLQELQDTYKALDEVKARYEAMRDIAYEARGQEVNATI